MADVFGNPPELVMFSGGKDSFLTACRALQSGHDVILLSFNNGSLLAEKNLLHGATRLMNRYGDDRVQYAGCYSHAAVIMRLKRAYQSLPWTQLGTEYPHMTPCQHTCLVCQTAMWVSAIAYAKAKSIPGISCGYREHDPFCTGLDWYRAAVSELAEKNGVKASFPVLHEPEWDKYPNSYGRNTEMVRCGFEPAVLEPKCVLGSPSEGISDEQSGCMGAYWKHMLLPMLQPEIDSLGPIFRVLRLSPVSMECPDYPVPDGVHGIY